MVKVKCKICGDIGYTACPNYLVCKCGGKFKVIAEDEKQQEAELGSLTLLSKDEL